MKRIVLTERDSNIIEFLEQYKCATTSTISTIFFNGSSRPCNRRLQYLREHGFIKSSQEYVSVEKVHYINKKPTQLKHSCISSSLIAELIKLDCDILKSKVEFKIGNVRSDLFIAINYKGNNYIYLVEVCNTKKFDLKKYTKLYDSNYWREYFPVFPKILVISDKEVEVNNKLDIKICKLNFMDLKIE